MRHSLLLLRQAQVLNELASAIVGNASFEITFSLLAISGNFGYRRSNSTITGDERETC
jgi:hypothetical protein